jgi:hypothetical protein
MFTFHFVTLSISFQIQYYVNVLIKFKQKKFLMWKNALQIFIYNDEEWTSKMAGIINAHRTLFID